MADPRSKCLYLLNFAFFNLNIFENIHSSICQKRQTRLVLFVYHIRSKLLMIETFLKIFSLPRSIKAMLSIPRKLGFPTGTLKQKFWGNEFSILGTKGTHVSVSETYSRFWKRKVVWIRDHLFRIFLDLRIWFMKFKIGEYGFSILE